MKRTKNGERRRWRPTPLTWIAVLGGVVGCGIFLYPHAAAWTASVNQSQLIADHSETVAESASDSQRYLDDARTYNAALSAGVDLESHVNVPTGVGETDSALSYESMLDVDESGVMARIRVPSIGVDLPIFHGTSDATLLKGAGHLEGSHLPVGGEGTHAVVTAHRGLADATMFSDLDAVEVGERFTIEVLDEVLTYEVVQTRVVAPEDTESLRPTSGSDLVTLVTCTPLGINTHRILVTGERVTPTPAADIAAAGKPSGVPGFPWWLIVLLLSLLLAATVLWRLGYSDAAVRGSRSGGAPTPDGAIVQL